MGFLIPDQEQMATLTGRIGVTPDNNFMLVQRITHPKASKVAAVIDTFDATNGLTGMTEKACVLIVTQSAIYCARLPWTFNADRIAAKTERIDHDDVSNLNVYQKGDQVHIEFDYSGGHFHSHQMRKYWARGQYNTDSLKHLLAEGFYGLMAPSTL